MQRYWKKRELASPQEFNYLCPINADLWVCNKIMVSRGGATPPNGNKVRLAGFDGQSRALPLQMTIILYGHVIQVPCQ
ncbi:hypothetical protein B5F96_11115 [Parabacteroides johnsonii]|jgi:hypothetical protein|uniref:Uncharacterized protein n=1 Tax=Parabacteroides johnsonii TaxID=387661 RepID=A0A9Q5X7W4_9BACT|nr:hypothetical protein B5F96_11115 [Parabacteroides johnsonii]